MLTCHRTPISLTYNRSRRRGRKTRFLQDSGSGLGLGLDISGLPGPSATEQTERKWDPFASDEVTRKSQRRPAAAGAWPRSAREKKQLELDEAASSARDAEHNAAHAEDSSFSANPQRTRLVLACKCRRKCWYRTRGGT